MKLIFVLDTGVLSFLVAPTSSKSTQFNDWVLRKREAGNWFVIPEIAYYELRRELVRIRSYRSLKLLDAYIDHPSVEYLPLTTEVMQHASELWAIARQQGKPSAHEHALDGDVILAAQARSLDREGRRVVVITTNKKHLSLFVDARFWVEVDTDGE